MRYHLAIITLLCTTTVFGQLKDYRAELNIYGRVSEFSVSPAEKIWMVTAVGNSYYTNSIDSNWHYDLSVAQIIDANGLKEPFLERISFFNKDTAIMTGYFTTDAKENKKNGLFYTANGGDSWKLIDFGGDTWIYDVVVHKGGKAWMGGSSGEIFYSSDFGVHWQKLKSPYDDKTRMNEIFMLDSNVGISGALHNSIYWTSNNWKSHIKVITPFDQEKYKKAEGYSDDRIQKILLWNDFIVVKQSGHIFYTKSNNIDWKSFPVPITDFELDIETKHLYAISNELQVISFSSPNDFKILGEEAISSFPIDLKLVNHSLYILCNGYKVYKANESGLKCLYPYTTDKKISDPHIIKHGKELRWGVNDGEIYLSENSDPTWFRENSLAFEVADFKLISDSVAILWDGTRSNYLYSLHNHLAKPYNPQNPLHDFLDAPIRSITIHAGSRGCFHAHDNEVEYRRKDDSTLECKKTTKSDYQKGSDFKQTVSSETLMSIMQAIDSNPAAIPALKDFGFTDRDKKNYLTMVDNLLSGKAINYSNVHRKIDKAFYYAVPDMLDSIQNLNLMVILNQGENISWSTTTNWFTIEIVNQNNKLLKISRNYYASTLPWNLSWKFEYDGLYFNCYNVDFSKFIKTCLPDNFIDKEVFDNGLLIMKIADVLYDLKTYESN